MELRFPSTLLILKAERCGLGCRRTTEWHLLLPLEVGSVAVGKAGESEDGVIGMLGPLGEMLDRTYSKIRGWNEQDSASSRANEILVALKSKRGSMFKSI